MSSLDKLLKAFENVRGSSQAIGQSRGSVFEGAVGAIPNISGGNFAEDSKGGMDASKSKVSITSTLAQQSQSLLSKRDHPLTTRDKLSLCQSVSESVIAGAKATGSDIQNLIAIGIETLMVLIDDEDPDVRMNADEALNRVIRSLSETHLGKIQLELFKEIKKNGSSPRSLRGALTRFAVLCHHIRPQKCRAYIQNLLPHLTKITKRPEENLHETLTSSLEKILPVLGYFTNDNEIRGLIRAFMPNISHPSASRRRSACSCLMLLCQYSRRPPFFFLWVLEAVLQLLIPIRKEASNHLILGGLLVLRSLAPKFPVLSSWENKVAQILFDTLGGNRSAEVVLTFDHVIQVYEICIHYSAVKDQNIVTASLEALHALLQNSSPHLIMALTTPEGLMQSRIAGEKRKNLFSRTPSQASIATSLHEDEASLEGLVDVCANIEIYDGVTQEENRTLLTQGERLPQREKDKLALQEEIAHQGEKEASATQGDQGQMLLAQGLPQKGQETRLINDFSKDDNESIPTHRTEETELSQGDQSTAFLPQSEFSVEDPDWQTPDSADLIAEEEENRREAVYSEIEIGPLSDTTLLLGRKELEIDESPSHEVKKRRITQALKGKHHDEALQRAQISTDQMDQVAGNIGSFTDEDLPNLYLVRYLCSSFLLGGRPGTLISDLRVKVSVKVLALNCLGLAISIQPSLIVEPLFIVEEKGGKLEAANAEMQKVEDVLLFLAHHDPQIRASVCFMVGQFIYSNLVSHEGTYLDFGSPNLRLEVLLELLSKLLNHNSSVTVRGALNGFSLFLEELLHSELASSALVALNAIMATASNSYWLVKVELCELLSRIPLRFVDFLESKEGTVGVHLRHASSLSSNSKSFSHRIVSMVFISLLKDQDQRVRKAAAKVIVSLLPHILNEGDTILHSAVDFIPSGRISADEAPCPKSARVSFPTELLRGTSSGLVPPCNHLQTKSKQQNAGQNNGEHGRRKDVDRRLAKLVHLLSSTLFSCNEKYLRLGCLEALSELCNCYPPVLHPKAWGCHAFPAGASFGNGKHLGVVSLVLAMSSEASLSGDLIGQQFILNIAANWLAGRAAYISNESKDTKTELTQEEKKKSWHFLRHHKLGSVMESLLQHILRILCVYYYVLEGTIPTVRNSLVQAGTAAALSPIKRKSKGDLGGEKLKLNTSGKKEEMERKTGSKRSFAHLPEYIKLYDVLKSAYQNYKMSLDDDVVSKFCDLLQEALSSLGVLLEMASITEFGRNAEDILQYLIVVTPILPSHAIVCGQQLLKCLFGSNLMSQWSQLSTPSLPPVPPVPLSPLEETQSLKGSPSFYKVVFSFQSIEMKDDLQDMSDGRMETLSSSLSTFGRVHPKMADKASLSSYIRLFEPLVIKALKLYTVSSDVILQRSVLELLIHLVQIRVNYCLLDSEQIFIGYVIKQFEYIEEGQIKNAEELIPAMFNFLVLLSYERHHSRSIIGVPKIIQLCDGLMASGQPPLSHCILALRPLVEDLFLERTHTSATDQKELETQREVICSMLLRLAQYYQVLQLLSIVLLSTKQNNKDRWRNLSRQITDTLLPKISKLQINIDSKDGLFALEQVLSSVCSSVFRPPDLLLKALLASPSEIESTEGVERWVGGVLLLLRVLVTRTPLEMALERLDQLGLNMEYIRHEEDFPEASGSIPSFLHQSLSPKRFGSRVGSPTRGCSTIFVDPLNAIQPTVKPQIAIARFLLEVLRVGMSELRSLEFTKLQGRNAVGPKPALLFHLMMQHLMLVVYLSENGQWDSVTLSFKSILDKEPDILKELNELFVFCARWHPALALRWCQFLAHIDYPSPVLWSCVLRTSHGKIGTPNKEISGKKIDQSTSLPLEFVRRAAFILFAGFVSRHIQEGEWLTWLLVRHVKDIVLLHNEPPVRALLQGVYSSAAASALLIQAFQARCDCVSKAEYGNVIISIISGVHHAQSGPLLVFLVDRLVVSPFLVVSRAAASLCAQTLHCMLAAPSETHLPLSDVKRLIIRMKQNSLNKRYGQVYSLLQQLLAQQQKDSSAFPPTDNPLPTSLFTGSPDLSWYLQLVKNRCCTGEEGGHECGELLSHLEYNDVLMVMSSKQFDLSLLPHAFRSSVNKAAQASSNSVESSSLDTYDDSEGSSVNSGGDPPFLLACKGVLLLQVNRVIADTPKEHQVFCPYATTVNAYTEELKLKFSCDSTFTRTVETITPSVTEFLHSVSTVPWKADVQPETLEAILRFAILNLELLHWQTLEGLTSVSSSVRCLACVDVVLKRSDVLPLLRLDKNTSAVFSMIEALHLFVSHNIKPDVLPSLAVALQESLSACDAHYTSACLHLMELISWLENGQDKLLPAACAHPIRGILIAFARTPSLNGVVRIPPELWTLGWSPEVQNTHPLVLPPFPPDLLQETEVLKQFIFRVGLLGFVGRQQFEETWMLFLSVLNSTPNVDTPLEEVPYINLSLSLAVRGITSLLAQTLLMPHPGNTHSSTVFHLPRDEPPTYLATKSGQRLKNMMHQLQLKLMEVQHIVRGVPETPQKYRAGQLSVEFLSSAVIQSYSLPDLLPEITSTSYEIELRESLLKDFGLDVQSCLHFLHYLYSTWLTPQHGLCSSVMAEVVKSVSILSDLFTSSAHHKWVLETFVPLFTTHPVEDHITSQYFIISTCKALATLKATNVDLSSSLTEGVLHIVEAGLRSIQVSVRTCALQGILYLLQVPQQENSPVITSAINYISKCNEGKSSECESHELAMWEVWVYMAERFPTSPDPTISSTALHMALTAAASPSTSPRLLHQVLKGVERLLLVQESSSGTVEVVLKLAMDLLLYSSPAISLEALPLFLTALHCSTRIQRGQQHVEGGGGFLDTSTGVGQHAAGGGGILSRPEDLASEPELLLQFMEKLSVLFDRIRVCLPYEAEVLAGLLGTCLLDILPASQLLNKVITEYISSHQPHPHLLAATLFQVFEAAMNEGGENLVQEWVLLSLSNFTQRTPIALAVWCLTCFFIAASSDRWLRSAFASVQARLGRLEHSDIQVFCLAGAHFRSSLATQQQRNKFDDVFLSAASAGTPFQELITAIKHSDEVTFVEERRAK